MTQLTSFELDDGTIIYMETAENVTAPEKRGTEAEEEVVGKRGRDSVNRSTQAFQNFRAIEGTIRAYTNYTLSAFRQVASADVDKVTLEFGIKVGGSVGIPYITSGTGESNIKITVECSFPNRTIPKQAGPSEEGTIKQIEPERIVS